jgi:hypothetical protein
MPPSGADTVCAILSPPLHRNPETIRSHRIEGTTPPYLESAADLALTVTRDGPLLRVRADVTNSGTGHHVPTGVTVRNVILLVEAFRADDNRALPYAATQRVHPLGGVGDSAQGYFAGLPGKIFTKLIEDFDGHAPTFFTDAARVVFDNRIPALATDSSDYAFVVPGEGGEVQIRARLIYRRAFRALVDAKGWSEDGHGAPLEDLQPPHFGHLMTQAEQRIATVEGDIDGDSDADLLDFAALGECWSGPTAVPPDVYCLGFDSDADGDIDLMDLGTFQSALRP